jgi:hypothetical protein
MHDAVRGEHIPREGARPNVSESYRCENPKRVASRVPVAPRRRVGRSQARADRYSVAPAVRVPLGRPAKARERRSGGILARLSWETLEGRKPKGASSGRLANRDARPEGTLEGPKAQEPRPVGPARRFVRLVNWQEKRHVGSSGRKRSEYPSGGESSEG